MEKVDAIVIGAGVIGLAVARALCLAGRSVIVVERHRRIGEETSSRNSGVIHSGIYYPTDSLKARLCVEGRSRLYSYCIAKRIPHARLGKLIVAQPNQLTELAELQETAVRNGVDDINWLDGNAVRRKEPEVRAAAGMWCPHTGIVSVHDLMIALVADIESAGGSVALRTQFLRSSGTIDGFEIDLDCDGEFMTLHSRALINAGGLKAVSLLSQIEGYPSSRIPRPFFAKGNYFDFRGRSPFRCLVYPMPNDAGLGVHATLDMAGRLRFGPDVEWLSDTCSEFDYSVTVERRDEFYAAIREYWPSLPDYSLSPAYAGVRPKLTGPGFGPGDFCIESVADHGVAGLVNLLGIESPGLTSSLAIGEQVAALLSDVPNSPVKLG